MRRAKSGNGSRVMRARLVRRVALALAVLVALGLVTAWFVGDRVLGRLESRTDCARSGLGTALSERHGVAFYAPLDEPEPRDLVTGFPLMGSGAVRVPGAVGSARRFDGQPGENLVGHSRWSRIARDAFTLALRIRLPESAPHPADERRLLWDHGEECVLGLRLRGDLLEARFTDASGNRVLSAAAPPAGRFAHLALSVGPEAAALYVEGTRVASCSVAGPLVLPAHAVAIGTDGHAPPAFDVDEWCVWNRALDDAEIARIAASRHSLADLLEPGLAAKVRRCAAQADAFRALCRFLGAFRAPHAVPTVLDRSIPALDLKLSRADRRHFRDAHLEAVASGFRTRRGARARRIDASFGGRTERVAAWLDEMVPELPLSSRPAFVLASENSLFGDGSGLVRLFPPEQFGVRCPDAARPLPLDRSPLVRLNVGGEFLGLYCLTPFEAPAPPWFATGPREVLRTGRLHFATPVHDPAAGAGLSEEQRENAWRDMLSRLGGDPFFPLRTPEAKLLARRHADTREALLLPDPAPAPAPVPSPANGLPKLSLFFGRPLDKIVRTDFVCLRVPPAADGTSPEWFSGTGAGRGGAKLRGNTSYIHGRRRSIHLKFDTPVSIPGTDVPVRHLLLLSGYADASRLRNALSFHAFRAMSPPDTVRAVPVFWAEVSVNGAAAGVWECCPRLQDVLSEPFSALFRVRTSDGLWTDPAASVEDVDRVDPGRDGTPDPYAPFRDLVSFVAEASPGEFAAVADEIFDLAELADFFLLVNFAGNVDGRVTNQFIGRRASDGRWLLLPWDYDKTFLTDRAGRVSRSNLLVSPLFARLFEDVPGFRERVAARWRELRAGPLSDDALDAWLDAHATLLAPCMDEDYRILPPIGHDGDFADAVALLRAALAESLSRLDKFAAPAP